MINKIFNFAHGAVDGTAIGYSPKNETNRYELIQTDVKGKVMKMEYREKKIPYFYINYSWVSFGHFGYTMDLFVDEEDSLVKEKNSDPSKDLQSIRFFNW